MARRLTSALASRGAAARGDAKFFDGAPRIGRRPASPNDGVFVRSWQVGRSVLELLLVEKHVNVPRSRRRCHPRVASLATPSCSSASGDAAVKAGASTAASATIGPAGIQARRRRRGAGCPAGRRVVARDAQRVAGQARPRPGTSCASHLRVFSGGDRLCDSGHREHSRLWRRGGASTDDKEGPGYDALPTHWNGETASGTVSHFSSGFVAVPDGDAGPIVGPTDAAPGGNPLTSPVTLSGRSRVDPCPPIRLRSSSASGKAIPSAGSRTARDARRSKTPGRASRKSRAP